MNLLAKYKAYIARLKKSGAKLSAYFCPHCAKEIEALVPPRGDRYDSMVECPHCGEMHFKIVDDRGHVDTKLVFIQRARRAGRTAMHGGAHG